MHCSFEGTHRDVIQEEGKRFQAEDDSGSAISNSLSQINTNFNEMGFSDILEDEVTGLFPWSFLDWKIREHWKENENAMQSIYLILIDYQPFAGYLNPVGIFRV